MFDFGFGNMFGRATQNFRQKNQNTTHVCNISLNEVYTGTVKKLKIKRDIKCLKCIINCNNCNGTGVSVQRIQNGPFTQIVQSSCSKCEGNGRLRNGDIRCSDCNSTGNITENKQVEINIYKGIEHNKTFLFEEWGVQSSKANEIPGDLVVVINIKEHPHFKRYGLDLIHEVYITLRESIVGKKIIVPHFKEELEIETSMFGVLNPSKFYIVNGMGLVDSTGNNKGNLQIKFNISYGERVFSKHQIDALNECFDKINF